MYANIDAPEENFNNYPAMIDSDGVGFEDGEYTGLEDDHVEFGGKGSSFATELRDHKTFTVTVNNTTAANVRVAFGSPIEVAANSLLLNEGALTGNNGVTCTGSPKSYDSFRKFVDKHPTRLIALKMQSNNTAQLAQAIVVTHFSPFENLGSKPLPISSFTKEESLNANMVTLRNLNYQLDDQTEIAIDIPANTQTVFTLYLGGVSNAAAALNKKANRAAQSSKVQAARQG
jgi:hypothetical protein